MNPTTYKVFVRTDAQSRIIAVQSDAFLPERSGWIQVDEGADDRYHHAQGNYLAGALYTADGIARYKLTDGKPVTRTDEEIAADRAAIVTPPTETEQLRADVDFLAAITGVEL